MIEVVEFRIEHLDQMHEQEATVYARAYLSPEDLATLAAHSSFTFVGDGRVLGCFGVVEHWPGRGEAWAMLDRDCRKYFLAMTNAARRFIDVHPLSRIEATVDAGFEAGHRWMRALGFQCEAPLMRGYRPNGGDSSLYAKVK